MSETTLKQCFDQISESVLITDTTGLVLYTNPAMSRRTGYAIPEIIGKKSGALWGRHMSQDFYTHFWQKISVRQEPFVGEVTNRYQQKYLYRETIAVAPIVDRYSQTHFFIELIPYKNEPQFYHTFQCLFSDQNTYQNDILSWITHTEQGASQELVSTITEALVNPIKKQFAARTEDMHLIADAKTETKAFAELYLKYKSDIHKYIRYHIDTPDVDDLAQETFIRAFRYLPHFTSSNANYLTYLRRIAHNLIVNYYRDKKTVASLEEAEKHHHISVSFLDHFCHKDMTDRLMATLTPFEQELLTERYLEDQPIHAIAVHLGKTDNAVKLALSRLRKKIKEQS